MAINLTEANLYGVGRGEAMVWGENKALGSLRQLQQQEQLRRAKEDAELQDQVAKVNVDAARNEDLPEIMQRYGTIKSTFAKMRGTTNSQERIQLQAELNQQKAELSRAVNVSKTAASGLKTIGDLRLTHADQISDEFAGKYGELSKLSSFDPKFGELSNDLSNNAMAPKFDAQKYAKGLVDRSTANYEGPKRVEKFGDKHTEWQDRGVKLDADAILKNATSDYTNDRSFRRYVDSQYKGIPADEAIKKFAADSYVNYKETVDKIEPKKLNEYTDDKFYEHHNYAVKHPIRQPKEAKDKTQAEIEQTDRQDLLDGMWNKTPGTGERVNAEMMGKGGYKKGLSFAFNGSKMSITVPEKSVAYGNEKGETHIKVEPARKLTFDRNKPADRFALNALVSEITGNHVNSTKLNTEQSKSKNLVTPASKLAPTAPKPASAPAKQQTAKAPTLKRSDIAARAAASGYSASEYEKLLKQKGVKIL